MMGRQPSNIGRHSVVPAQFDAVLDPLRTALEACGARGPFGSVAWGRPEPDDGQWLDLDAFATEAGAAPAIRSYGPAPNFAKLVENWVLQNAAGTALLVAGYLYAVQRRVPALQGNSLLHTRDWLQHLRLVQPRLRVLADDPLGGVAGVTIVADHQALTAALFDEVERTYEPIILAFRTRRQVSIANAWAAVVDGLLRGFLLAGRAEIGLDAAWELWRSATSTWPVATRRWPRRVQFAQDGFRDEVVVRASCCLFFTSSNSAGAKQAYCSNCPIDISDEGRIRRMVDWLKQLDAQR